MNQPFNLFAQTNFQHEENVQNINFDDLRCVTIFSPPGYQSLTAVRSVFYPLLFPESREVRLSNPISREVKLLFLSR